MCQWLVGCLCLGIALPVAFIAAPQFIEKHDRFEQPIVDKDGYLRTPGNMSKDMWWPGCAGDVAEDVAKFSEDNEWKLVKFKSQEGSHGESVIELTAWWLPVRDAAAPRIVVQHGNNVNFNDWTVNTFAFFLRSMGFAVLVPNLRDHGSSGKSSHASKISWGFDYHLDVLAAWEYAVNDPHGKLGGKMPSDKVGILGQSMGGFASAIAFGLNTKIPAVWLDSAVFAPEDVFQNEIYKVISGKAGSAIGTFVSWFTIPYAWAVAKNEAGVDISLQSPEEAIKNGDRKVAIVHAKDDCVVPVEQAQQYDDYFKALGYDVALYSVWEESECNGTCHVSMMVKTPEQYYAKLCKFWHGAFDMKEANVCKMDAAHQQIHVNYTKLYADMPGGAVQGSLLAWWHPPVFVAIAAAVPMLFVAGLLAAVKRRIQQPSEPDHMELVSSILSDEDDNA